MSSEDIIQGGSLANISGNTLERIVLQTLVPKGFVLVPYRDYKRNPKQFGGELLLRNAEYTTIYGHPGKTEFLLISEKYRMQTRIECKWQQSAGSVDEKFPYLYLNCVEAMPESHVMIIVDGGGAKAGAVEWLRNASQKGYYLGNRHGEKQIDVFSLSEFIAWANRRFR